MKLLDRLLYLFNFPYGRHRAQGAPGTPSLYREHLEAMFQSVRWNHLYVEPTPEQPVAEGSYLKEYVAVTRWFRDQSLQLQVNLSAHTTAGAEAIDQLVQLVPSGWKLDQRRSKTDYIMWRGRDADLSALAAFIDAVFRQVYGCPAGYRVDVIAQALPPR